MSIADEVPFEIPESWEWVRVKSCTELYNGRAFKPSDWTPDGLPIVRIQNLNDRNAPFNRYNQNVDEYVHLHGGELLFAWSGTPGTSFGAHIWDRGEAVLNQHIFKLLFSEECLYKPYYMYALNERVGSLINAAHGSAGLQHVTRGVFEATLIPLPPYKEQIRIVDKLHEIEPLIQQYGLAYDAAQKMNTAFPEQLKKSILQLAVQGKLVPQDPSNEPASMLLEHIRAEKERLIKEGKIKRDKNESVIYRRDNSHYEKLEAVERCIDDEIPFELPNSWAWARLSNLINLLSGQDFEPSGYNSTGRGIPYITGASNIDDGNVIINRWTECPKNIAHTGELLLVCKGAGVGKMAELKEESAHIARQIMAITPIYMSLPYLRIVLEHNLEYLRRNMQGVIPGISRSDVLNLLCPVPPIAEQIRIAEQIGSILPMVKAL